MSSSIQMTTPSPPTMRAWSHIRTGPPSSVLTLSSDFKSPTTTSSDEILVRVSHAALNPGGSFIMHLVPAMVRKSPAIPEYDFAGTIVSSSVAGLEPGTAVFGMVPAPTQIKTGGGTLAEYVVSRADMLARKPTNMSFEEAAGLALTGCTALLAIDNAKLQQGDTVLVNGGSGGIGVLVVQLAKNLVGKGGKVVVTCSGANVDLVKGLGADEVIDYTKHSPVHRYLTDHYSSTPFSAVIDTVGSLDVYAHSAPYLASKKPYVSVGFMVQKWTYSNVLLSLCSMIKTVLWPQILGGTPRDYINLTMSPDGATMDRLRVLVEEGKLKQVIDSCWEMEDVLKAYDRILSHRARGKVVVKIQEPPKEGR